MTTQPSTNAALINSALILVTKDPSHPLAHLALRYAQACVATVATIDGSVSSDAIADTPPLQLFFYGDSAHLANRLRWQPADQRNLTQEWQHLAESHKVTLPVCVSTALNRGVSDSHNSVRHQLTGDNLASGFSLVGLSEFAMMLQTNSRLVSF